jgi:hypothetical protein
MPTTITRQGYTRVVGGYTPVKTKISKEGGRWSIRGRVEGSVWVWRVNGSGERRKKERKIRKKG